MPAKKIIVVGASAGGVPVLQTIARSLPSDFPTAMVIVLHIGARNSRLPTILGLKCQRPVVHATDKEPIEPGTIYVAPPDHHLSVDSKRLYLVRGPMEHFTRPAVDPLFRSAADAFGWKAVGVVLTGNRNDGAAGLQAIKAHGGITIVQDPLDAESPEMPSNALRTGAVDYFLPVSQIASTLMELVGYP